MKRKISLTLFVSFAIVFLFNAMQPTYAQGPNLRNQIGGQIDASAQQAIGGQPLVPTPQSIVASLIKVLLGLVGTVFLILMLLSGYWFFTARGDDTKVDKAIHTIRAAVIGLTIVLMAYAITRFVSSRIEEAAKEETYTTPSNRLHYQDFINDIEDDSPNVE